MRDSASSGTLSFWVRACVLSRGGLHFACFLLSSCSSPKIKGHREHAGFGLLRDPLFLGPLFRGSLHFACFLLNNCSSSKIKVIGNTRNSAASGTLSFSVGPRRRRRRRRRRRKRRSRRKIISARPQQGGV